MSAEPTVPTSESQTTTSTSSTITTGAQTPSFTTSFHQAQLNQREVLLNGYVNKTFSSFSFANPKSNIFQVKANVTQSIENNGTTQVRNNGLLELHYAKDDLKFAKTIDVNRNLTMRIDKTLKQSALQGHTIFGKFNSGSSPVSNEYQIIPYFGFFKNQDRYAYKAKFNMESLIAQVKVKAMYPSTKDSEVYGAGLSAGFDFKQNLTQNFKSLLYYHNPSTSMSLRHETKRGWRLEDSTIEQNQHGVAVELNHDSIEKKFGMLFGAKYTKFNKVVCRAKIDEKFLVNSSFQINLTEQARFTISNVIDLSLRNKKDASAPLNQEFPIGFALDIQQ